MKKNIRIAGIGSLVLVTAGLLATGLAANAQDEISDVLGDYTTFALTALPAGLIVPATVPRRARRLT